MEGKNPCELCKRSECDDCQLRTQSLKNYCATYDCVLNYEGNCLMDFFENCGAWGEEEAEE